MEVELDYIPPRHIFCKTKGYLGRDEPFYFCWYCCKAFGPRKPKAPHQCEERQKLHDAQVALGWIKETDDD